MEVYVEWNPNCLIQRAEFDISTYLTAISETQPWMWEVVALYFVFSHTISPYAFFGQEATLWFALCFTFCKVWTAATVLIVAGHICAYQPPPWHRVRLEGGQAQTEHVNASPKVEPPDYFHFFSFLLNRSNWNPASLDPFSKEAGLLRAVPLFLFDHRKHLVSHYEEVVPSFEWFSQGLRKLK